MNNKKVLPAAFALLLAQAGAARAELSGNVAIVSDYLFDGVSQTDNNPALQAGVEWAAEMGLYAGAWGSNVDFGEGSDSSLEMDLYAGYRFGGEPVGFDVGYIRYLYLDGLQQSDDDIDYGEIYAGVTLQENTTLKYWYTDDYSNSGDAAWRVKLSHSIAINDTFSIPLELTHSDFEFDEINHLRVGVAASVEGFDLDLSYHRTDADEDVYDKEIYATDGRFVFSVARSF